MTAAAMAIVAMKVLMLRSKRVATLLQSLKRRIMLDDVTLPVDYRVAVELGLAVLFGGDNSQSTALGEPLMQIVEDETKTLWPIEGLCRTCCKRHSPCHPATLLC